MYEVKTFEQFHVGDQGSFSKTITEADVVNFAGTSGDFNPLHMNAEYAKGTMFKQRIAHGALVSSLISTAGAMFVGLDAIYISQLSKFMAPVFLGDTITATMEVMETFPEKNRIRMKTYCTNQAGKVVIDGEAFVMIPKAKKS